MIDDWKAQRLHGTMNAFLVPMIQECVDVGAFCDQIWQYVHELLHTDPNGAEIYEVGNVLKPELAKTLSAFDWIQERVAEANGVNSPLEWGYRI